MRHVLTLIIMLAATAQAATIDDRMSLIEAIDAVRTDGFRISYSTRLVQEWMRVRETPEATDPIEALRNALSAYELDIVAMPGDAWVIVAAEKPTAIEAMPPAEPEPAPEIEAPLPLDEITIVASRHAMYSRRAADQFLTAEDIQQMPHMADDAFRAFHRLPGVAASDFQAPFNLRGGAVDEVKVQVNGIELLEPFHMRTLFQPLSIIDPGVIGEAQVLSGGFTAKHGRYMSGVIDIATAYPDSAPMHEVGVSFVSAFARSRGQFAGGRGSYFISGRRGYLDLIADSVTDDDEELDPRYGDLFGSLRYALNDSVDIAVETLLADDKVRFVDPGDGEDFGEDSQQQHLWLSADVELENGIFSRTSLFGSNIESQEEGSQINAPAESVFRFYDRDIDVFGMQTDWSIPVADAHVFEVGAMYRDLSVDFDYRLNSVRRTDFVNNGLPFALIRDIQMTSDGSDLGLYASYRNRLSDRLIWELGARWDKQTYTVDVDDTQVSPRFNAQYALNDRAELRLAWGHFYQAHPIQDLAIPDGDTNYYGPERAEHRVLGLRYRFEADLDLQVDLYQKLYEDLRPRYENLLDIYEYAPESNFDRARIDPSSGEAYGVELTLRNRNVGALDWWINYTWSKVEDTIDGVTVPRSWDQRNAFTANVAWRGDRWRVSVIGRYHSGWPRTPLLVDPIIDANNNIVGAVVDLTERNSVDFDDYSRVDFRVSRLVPLERGSFEYYFEVFNVFDTTNQCCTTNHSISVGQGISVSPEFDEFLPRFPSFGFVWRFGPGADSY